MRVSVRRFPYGVAMGRIDAKPDIKKERSDKNVRKNKRKLTACALTVILGLSCAVYPVYAEETQSTKQTGTGELLELDETAVPTEESPEVTPEPETGGTETIREEQENKADKEESTSEPVETEQEIQSEAAEQTSGEVEPQEQIGHNNTFSTARASTVSISNADQLIDFANRVNNGETSLNAELTNNIDMSGKTCVRIDSYYGIFDGNGFKISNYSDNGYNGSFVEWNYGTIKKLIISGTLNINEGGFVAVNEGTIENCAVYLDITASGYCNGGIVGNNYAIVRNCIYGGQISTSTESGAIVGWEAGSTTNCYYVKQNSGVGAFGSGSGSAEEKSSEQFASGEITWLLNDRSSEGIWKQTIGTDNYPNFTGDTVYHWTDGTYQNKQQPQAPTPTVEIDNTKTTASSITVKPLKNANIYGGAEYSKNGTDWQDSNIFTDLHSAGYGGNYVVYARYKGNDSYLQSEVGTLSVSTNSASYTITIPADPDNPLEAGKVDSTSTISVNQDQTFDLGYNGQLDIKVKKDDKITNQAVLTLTRQNDTENHTVTSALLVNGKALGNINTSVAIFKNKSDSPVTVSFAKPTETNIPAGTYNGTITFEVSYSES
ncbi:hypothetical protein MKC73_12665 [[Clostridium] innocuum]|nr:hypothetical protein [[Clostridium] innocuum]